MEDKLRKQYERCKGASEFGGGVEGCYEGPRCHFCSDPYVCTIPHLIEHLLGIKHGKEIETFK